MIKKIKNAFGAFKRIVLKQYPISMCAIWIGSILLAIGIDMDAGAVSDFVSKCLIFLWVFAVGAVCTEELFEKNWVAKACGFTVSGLFAGWCVFLSSYEEETLFGISFEKVAEFFAKFLVCYIVWLVMICLFHRIKKSGLSVAKYATIVFGNAVKVSIVYGILAIGVAIILAIFNVLIWDTGSFLARVEIVLLCGMYLPGFILAVSDTEKEIGKFVRFLVKYVLLSLLMTAFLIIYVYIFKLLVTVSLPSNQVFPILTFLFICGLPIWTMAGCFEQDRMGKIAKILPFVFAPFIILQGICVGMRIAQYGLTSSRYMGIFLIMFEVIYLILYMIFRQRFLPMILLVGAFLVTGFLIVPGWKAEDMVYLSQKGRMENYLLMSEQEREAIDKETARKINGTRRELLFNAKGEIYLDSLSEQDTEFLAKCSQMANTYNWDEEEILYMNANAAVQNLNVDGYSSVYIIRDHSREYDIENYALSSGEFTVVMDFSDYLKEVEKAYRSKEYAGLNEWFGLNNELAGPDGGKLIMQSITVKKIGERIEYFYVNGFYLK